MVAMSLDSGLLQSWSRKFSCVCTSITVVIPLPIQCGSDLIPNPMGPAFASLSYLIFAIATVQLVSPLSVSVASEQACLMSVRFSQLPANKLVNPNLVTRPSHHPVFDGLQYPNNREGRPGPFYHVNGVSIYLGRQRGVGIKRPSSRTYLVVLPQALEF